MDSGRHGFEITASGALDRGVEVDDKIEMLRMVRTFGNSRAA
ncbi:MAG: hypothetical protein V1792_18470 [Pseudomonadota bacterium]